MNEVFFPGYIYFTHDFPFCINRYVHTVDDVNESVFHRREFWKIFYVIAGEGEFLINNCRYPLHAGTVIVCHPDSKTTFRVVSSELHVCNILFLPELIRDELFRLENYFDFFSIFHVEEPRLTELYITDLNHRLRRIIRDLEQEFRCRESNYRTVIRMRLIELLIALSRRCKQSFRSTPEENAVQYLLCRIENGFREQLSLDMFARETGIGKTRLCLLFRRATGRSVMETLRRRRLEEAKRQIRSTQSPIIEICYRCGFQDLSNFHHRFRREFGMTPLEWRKNRK